ncbi:MAG: 3-alpha domain-containing protein [Anaerolineae bacterium]|nr:3-alpha domain-containing protein [Anaerolineae bacterium]
MSAIFYRVGDAQVQVTQPRVPCYKLGIRMNDPSFVKRFMQAERTGFYLRILQEGFVAANDEILLESEDPQQMTVRDINHLLYFESDPKLAEKALKIEALSPGWRGSFESMLES